MNQLNKLSEHNTTHIKRFNTKNMTTSTNQVPNGPNQYNNFDKHKNCLQYITLKSITYNRCVIIDGNHSLSYEECTWFELY